MRSIRALRGRRGGAALAICSVVLSALMSWGARAQPAAPLIVPVLVAGSDMIVAGQYLETVIIPGRTVRATLRVDRIIKGKLAAGSHNIDLGLRDRGRLVEPRYGMFFLRGEAGHYALADEKHFDLPAARPEFQVFPRQDDPLLGV